MRLRALCGGGQLMDNEVHMVRLGVIALTPITPEGKLNA